nr:CPBP family intramembrane glutamic endopeptidase [Tomitella biformata]
MLWLEIAVVLMITYGYSALSSILQLARSAVAEGGIGGQTVALNTSRAANSLIDLAFQLIGISKLLAIAGLALYLLWRSGIGPKAIGLMRAKWRPDVLHGLALAALIGIPGLAFYLAGRVLGWTSEVQPSALDDHWWRIPTLILAAIANSAAEETLVVAYLLTRLRRLGFSPNAALAYSSLLRAGYHLYQGVGPGLGNLAMGLIFGRYWQRTGRLWPLIIAHALIDVIAFVGYALLSEHVSWLH